MAALSSRPGFSVITPTYRDWQRLGTCLAALAGQSLPASAIDPYGADGREARCQRPDLPISPIGSYRRKPCSTAICTRSFLSEKLIDVVIPAFNADKTVVSAVASMQRQTVQDIGIIVVDDGSTDATPTLLEAMARDDRRITIVRRPNGGIVDALNEGLDHVTAPFVARFDADDLAFEDRLQRQFDFLQAHPDHVAVGGNVWHIDDRGRRTGSSSHFDGEAVGKPRWVPAKEPYLLHPFLMVRTDALRQVGGYRYVFHAEDSDLYWRLARIGRLYSLPDMLGEYRIHPGSITGVSVINGRISALNAQLAAISTLRSASGAPDLVFDKSLLGTYQEQRHIAPMLSLWHEQLSPDERRYLEVAVAAKLMELAAYRPYELEPEDCRFIRRAIARNITDVSPANGPRLAAKYARTFARLLRTRHLTAAAAMAWLR